MSSKRYFLAKSMNPFIGRFGLSELSFSFFFAGDDGGDIFELTGTSLGTGRASGEIGSSVENSNLRNRSHTSGVRTASGWFGGKQTSPTLSSWNGMPNFSRLRRVLAELQPETDKIMSYTVVKLTFAIDGGL